MPVWWDVPDTVLGGVVTTQFVLARSRVFAIAVRGIVAYPTGFSFEMVVVAREGKELPDSPHLPGMGSRHEESEDGFRFCLQLADGTKVVADPLARYFDGDRSQRPDLEGMSEMEKPPRPFLSNSGSGGGTSLKWHTGYWAAPLPPPGPLGFVVEWLKAGLTETAVTIEADLILNAAATATSIWSP